MSKLLTKGLMLFVLFSSLSVVAVAAETHPLVEKVFRFRDAREVDPAAAAKEFYAADSRIWYEKKEGRGRQRGPEGTGPWAVWDKYFRGETSPQEHRVEGRTVTLIILENNEFYRLIEQSPKRVNITYYFDENDRVAGTLVASGETSPNRFEEAVAWAREHHPEEVQALMPEGRIVPSLENARRWRRLLNAWRETVGLPVVEESEDR